MTPDDFKKIKHFEIEGHAHYLTFSCYRGIPLLSKERTCNWFVEAVTKARVEQEFDLWAWVIMPNHAHLLLWPRRANYKMGSILQAIKQPVGIRAMGYLRKHSPKFLSRLRVINKNRTYYRFWQSGGGFDGNQVEAATIHEIIEYSHNNPVRAGLVAKATDWKYSSARDWAGIPDVILPVDRTVPTWLNARK